MKVTLLLLVLLLLLLLLVLLEWCPPVKIRKGIPRNSWIQEVTTGLREKEINNLE